MNKAEVLKLQDDLRKIIEADGDSCSVCGLAFPHKGKTYGGATVDGEAAIVGECCVGKMKEIVGAGIYLKPVRGFSKYH